MNNLSQGMRGKAPVWYSYGGPQFRNEIDAHQVDGVRMRHTGWYTDMHGNEMCVPVVGQLTHGRYIAGYRCTDTGERVYFDLAYADALGAAHGADSEARIYAEAEQAYDCRWQEAHALRNTIDCQIARLEEIIALRNNPNFRHLRYAAPELVADIRTMRAKLESDYSDVEF